MALTVVDHLQIPHGKWTPGQGDSFLNPNCIMYTIYTLFLSVGCVSHDTRWQPNKTESSQFGVESLGASFVA